MTFQCNDLCDNQRSNKLYFCALTTIMLQCIMLSYSQMSILSHGHYWRCYMSLHVHKWLLSYFAHRQFVSLESLVEYIDCRDVRWKMNLFSHPHLCTVPGPAIAASTLISVESLPFCHHSSTNIFHSRSKSINHVLYSLKCNWFS